MLQKWILFPGSRKLIFPPGRPLNSFSYNRVAESYRLIESCFSGSFLYVSTVSNLSFAKNFSRHWSVGPKFIWILSSLTENMFPFMFYAYKKNPPCILKKREWKAFFIKANMCRVRRAGSLLSADQLVLSVFKVTDGITPPSPPPLYNLVFSPTYLHATCIIFFEHISFSLIVMRSWGEEHTACSLLIGGKSYWARIPDYTSFSDEPRVRLLKLGRQWKLVKRNPL